MEDDDELGSQKNLQLARDQGWEVFPVTGKGLWMSKYTEDKILIYPLVNFITLYAEREASFRSTLYDG